MDTWHQLCQTEIFGHLPVSLSLIFFYPGPTLQYTPLSSEKFIHLEITVGVGVKLNFKLKLNQAT